MKPNWAVLTPMMQISTLFAAATIQPYHCFRPTRTVDTTVKMHDMKSSRNTKSSNGQLLWGAAEPAVLRGSILCRRDNQEQFQAQMMP
jgi:hypothetical protein